MTTTTAEHQGMDGNEALTVKNVKKEVQPVSEGKSAPFLTDSLRGVLKSDYDDKANRAEKTESRDCRN